MSLGDVRPVRRFVPAPGAKVGQDHWPYAVPAVGQVLREGLDVPAGVTFLVGENGSGKSTLIEAMAMAYGLNPEGGSVGAMHRTRESESPLGGLLEVVRTPGRNTASYFLRAETMHGLYTYLENNNNPTRPDPRFHEMSHGESFLSVLQHKFSGSGFYLMDEPESALSFTSCLGLVGVLDGLRRRGAQVIVATHSPLLTALPGATILEVGEDGIRPRAWTELSVVGHWRDFLSSPDRYLRHLL